MKMHMLLRRRRALINEDETINLDHELVTWHLVSSLSNSKKDFEKTKRMLNKNRNKNRLGEID